MFNKRGKAFECDKCPKNNNPELGNFCPAWWEQAWTEQGVEQIKKDCASRLLPNMMVVLGATSRLSMSTAQEMNKRLDIAEKMCQTDRRLKCRVLAMLLLMNIAELMPVHPLL